MEEYTVLVKQERLYNLFLDLFLDLMELGVGSEILDDF